MVVPFERDARQDCETCRESFRLFLIVVERFLSSTKIGY